MTVVLKWARFVGFPVVALLILLSVQAKSARGAKFGLGETEVQVDVTTATRRAEPVLGTAAAISVITGEQIRLSDDPKAEIIEILRRDFALVD